MDGRKYSSLMDAVADVPDPRKARGKRHPWALLLMLISAALVCGQRNGRAIGQWVAEHADELRTQLALPPRTLPRSEEHTSELQSRQYLVCRLLLEKTNALTAGTRCRTRVSTYAAISRATLSSRSA